MKKVLGIVVCFFLTMASVLPVVAFTSDNDYSKKCWATESPFSLKSDWIVEQKLLSTDETLAGLFGYSVSLDGDNALIGAPNDNVGGLAGSAYIFTRVGTAWAQQAKLVPTSGGFYDYFGWAVSLDGDTALIGAPGSQFTPDYEGAAYVFIRTGTTWTQQARLVASDGHAEDYFGNSLSLNGDTAIIGSEYWSGPGSAYVFTRSGTEWDQQTKLVPADGFNGESFGMSLSLEGNTLFIGAPFDDDNGGGSGSVYVYARSGSTWTQQTKLLASDGSSLDFFGQSVELSSGSAVVGADWDSDNGAESGSAYVFIWTGTSWTEQAKLLPSDGDADDHFGYTVSVNGDTILVGANEDDDPMQSSGSAYIFTRSGSTWTQQAKLLASDYPYGRLFGQSVSLDGDIALIGAYGDNESGPAAGAAYVFVKESTPPSPPAIDGQTKGKKGVEYDYTFLATDPENDQVFYFIDWGDGTNSSWIGPYDSGVEMTKSHGWSEKGSYTIKAKAKDISGKESDWGTLPVTMPYHPLRFPFLQWLLDRFPSAFPVLRLFLNYYQE